MDQLVNPYRCCPECSSREYVFRGRKKLTADQGQPAAIETKYMCKECGRIAEGIYQERAFNRLPILADALLDAGCDAEDLLAHCRTSGLLGG
jgi:DNA-directed RNA polymerase subunit RPC12/RpoP